MVRVIREGYSNSKMIALEDWGLFFANVGLLIATMILGYFTYTLERTTDRLGRLQIKPSLSWEGHDNKNDAKPEDRNTFHIKNKGVGVAKITNVRGLRDNGTEVLIKPSSNYSKIDAILYPSEPYSYDIWNEQLGTEVNLTIDYSDVEDHPQKSFEKRIMIN